MDTLQKHLTDIAKEAAEALIESGDWDAYEEEGENTDDLIEISWEEQFSEELAERTGEDVSEQWPVFLQACKKAVSDYNEAE